MNKPKDEEIPKSSLELKDRRTTYAEWLRFGFVLAAVIWLFLPYPLQGANAVVPEVSAPTAIGYIEEVILLPWGMRLPARVDTGASMTSLDARNIVVKETIVTFKLPEEFGERVFELPLVRWGHVSSSMGVQQRPVVEMELCLGDAKFKVRVNLNDRSGVKYPLIIGRNLLRKGFVVDSRKVRLLPPSCPGAVSK